MLPSQDLLLQAQAGQIRILTIRIIDLYRLTPWILSTRRRLPAVIRTSTRVILCPNRSWGKGMEIGHRHLSGISQATDRPDTGSVDCSVAVFMIS